MKLFEFNLEDLFDLSNEEIDQDGLPSTINRYKTSEFISNYKVVYDPNSYYNNGILEFTVYGQRGAYYAFDGDLKKIRDPQRRGKQSKHTVKIKPKTLLANIDELGEADIDIHCTCNDFRYVFMNMAYEGYKRVAGVLSKYGLLPIKSESTRLKRVDPDNVHLSGDPDARIRNPHAMGALCKHSLLVVDRLLYDVDQKIINQIQRDIDDKNERDDEPAYNTTVSTRDDDFVDLDNKYYDREGMVKHKSKISLVRGKKIEQLRIIIQDTEVTGLVGYKGDFDSSFEDFKQNMLQSLMTFDSYYLDKADKEGVSETKYLPDDYESSYDDLDFEIERVKSIIEYNTVMSDDTLGYVFKDVDDDKIDDLDDYLDTFLSKETTDIDSLINDTSFEDTISRLLGESNKHIKNFNNFNIL